MALSLEVLGKFPVYGPAEGENLAGVVILHGSEGPWAGWSHRFAAILAAHGYLAMPHGYGEGTFWGAGGIKNVPISDVMDSVDALAAHPRCRGAGIFGWSRGGELAMLVASLVANAERLPFVAAHAPSNTVNAAFDPEAFKANPASRGQTKDRAWDWPEHSDKLAPGLPIEIENYPGPVFLSVGTADEIWDHQMTLYLSARLKAAGNPADLLIADGQGHGYDFDREPELWERLFTFIERSLP